MMPSGDSPKALVNPVEIDAINYINIALMVVAIVIAAYVPFETFLVAYAVLGPLHYLTEISWLHDRKYFTSGAWDWVPLVIVSILGALAVSIDSEVVANVASFGVGALFIGAAGMVFARSGIRLILFVVVAMVVGGLTLNWDPLFILFTAFLPTLIHVYLFTGFFILHGALKGRNLSGLLSLVVFCAAPFVCLFGVSTPSGYSPSEYTLEAVGPFYSLALISLDGLGAEHSRENLIGFMRLMGFAYTYHYLNWFSKTRLINWHQISRQRLSGIVVVYIAALALYGYNYRWGLIGLMTLSLAHVMLELPLNFRTLSGISLELRRGAGFRET